MLARLGHGLLILALLGATGGHWLFLKSVAWTTMLIDESRTAPFSVAVAKTFNGKNPCTLCKGIEAGKRTEQKTELPAPDFKLEFFHTPAATLVLRLQLAPLASSAPSGFTPRTETPPLPPPRVG